ncbi:MAG: MFS transporter [Thermodesulfobacteriota bacterium]
MPLYLTFALALSIMTIVQAGRVLLTLYALALGAQPFAVGLLAAAFSVLPMLLSWQIGRFTDRFGSRWPLLFGTVGGACGMLLPYFVSGLPAIFAAGVMNGLLFAFSGSSLQNLVGLLSRPETSARNFSNYSVLISTTGFGGPLLAGFSIDHAGHAVACLYLVLLSLVPAGLLAFRGGILPGGSRAAPPAGSLWEMLAGSGLWRVLATGSLVVSGIDLFQVYMPIYGHAVGLSASAIGVVLAMFSLSAFVVRLFLPRLIFRFTEARVLALSFCIGAVSFLLVPFFEGAVMLALISFLFGLGMGCGQPITLMMTYGHSPQGRSGEAMGLRVTVNHMTRVVVPVLFGSVGSLFGLLPVFWVNALLLASGGVITRPGKKDRTL